MYAYIDLLKIVVVPMYTALNEMTKAECIVERRKATKRLNAEIRAMPEFAAVVVETEAHCRAHADWLAHAQVFNHAGEIDNGQK